MIYRHWFRRDVILPIVYLGLFGAALYVLHGYIIGLPIFLTSTVLLWLVRSIWILYAVLFVITMSHVLSTYDLERYDPGNLNSLKRLMKRQRYRLRRMEIPTESVLVAYEAVLLDKGYRLEADSHQIGRIYVRRRFLAPILRIKYDRVILLQHEPLNVFMIDQLLQDSIRYIKNQIERQSKRNLLIIITRMQEIEEVASCGAGVVNFLGKFVGGTLGVILLATRHHRLFYPADRTVQPYIHRCYQNLHRFRLKHLITREQHALRKQTQREASS